MTIHLNCDLGEYPDAVERDKQLLQLVDAVNIACGGHAGSKQSAQEWKQRADEHNKSVHLHLSYPDKKNFGRLPMDMPWTSLRSALDMQREALPTINAVKFHGALYNISSHNEELAIQLLGWCKDNNITTLLAPPGSAMASRGNDHGIAVLTEGFADRSYQLHQGRLRLTPRNQSNAVHDNVETVIEQMRSVLEKQRIPTDSGHHNFHCDTWCIHSDSDGAIEMATAIREVWK